MSAQSQATDATNTRKRTALVSRPEAGERVLCVARGWLTVVCVQRDAIVARDDAWRIQRIPRRAESTYRVEVPA